MPIIIVEGIDRVGKTTLCNELSKALDIPIVKDTYIEGKQNGLINVEKMNSILNTVEAVGYDFISDRFHWTEAVYGYCDRGYDNTKLVQDIETRLMEISALGNRVLIIYIEPVDIHQSSAEHGSNLQQHDDLFKALYKETALDKIKSNISLIEPTVKIVSDWFKENNY